MSEIEGIGVCGETAVSPIITPPILPMMAEVEWDEEIALDEQTEEEEEGLAKVIIHNDEVTPMDFVIVILQRIFQLLPLEAEHVMVTAHFNGLALVATLPLSEAKKRVGKAHFAAQLEGYPLQFTIELV
ncbi:ATP-dependent Clp protease adaptor protein ClpS [hydrothermal vent metagenome]|uniref:ATP-dependent Clp protease adaptor protein ClpS n=1 Tax=hydrothermal vent metagenome TaxID=652676 RepID=A0A3B0V025_9ZZZZ